MMIINKITSYIWFKSIAIALIAIFIWNDIAIAGDFFYPKNSALAVAPLSSSPEKSGIAQAIMICETIEKRAVATYTKPIYLDDILLWKNSSDPEFQDVRFDASSAHEIIITIPKSKIRIRYFDPDPQEASKPPAIPPFSDSTRLETKVINDHLYRQIFYAIKALPGAAGPINAMMRKIFDELKAKGETDQAYVEAGRQILEELLPRQAYFENDVFDVQTALDILHRAYSIQRTAYNKNKKPAIYDTINIAFMKKAIKILERYHRYPVKGKLKNKLRKLVHWAHAITVFFTKYQLYMKLREASRELKGHFNAREDVSPSIQKLQKLLGTETDRNIPEVRQCDDVANRLKDMYILENECDVKLVIIHFLSHMLQGDLSSAADALDSLAKAVEQQKDIKDDIGKLRDSLINIGNNTIVLGHLISDNLIEKMANEKIGNKILENAKEKASSRRYALDKIFSELKQDVQRRAGEPQQIKPVKLRNARTKKTQIPWGNDELTERERGLINHFRLYDSFDKLVKTSSYSEKAAFFRVLAAAEALENIGGQNIRFEQYLKVNIKGTEFEDKENPSHTRTGVEADITVEFNDGKYFVEVKGGKGVLKEKKWFFHPNPRRKMPGAKRRYRIVAKLLGYKGTIFAMGMRGDKPSMGKITPLDGEDEFYLFKFQDVPADSLTKPAAPSADILQATVAELERLQGEEKTQIPVINEMKIGWPEETMGIEQAFHFARSRQLFFENERFYYFGSGVAGEANTPPKDPDGDKAIMQAIFERHPRDLTDEDFKIVNRIASSIVLAMSHEDAYSNSIALLKVTDAIDNDDVLNIPSAILLPLVELIQKRGGEDAALFSQALFVAFETADLEAHRKETKRQRTEAYQRGLAFIEAALVLTPDDNNLLREQAYLLSRLGRGEEAEKILTGILQDDTSRDKETILGYARLTILRQIHQQFIDALEAKPPHPEEALTLFNDALQKAEEVRDALLGVVTPYLQGKTHVLKHVALAFSYLSEVEAEVALIYNDAARNRNLGQTQDYRLPMLRHIVKSFGYAAKSIIVDSKNDHSIRIYNNNVKKIPEILKPFLDKPLETTKDMEKLRKALKYLDEFLNMNKYQIPEGSVETLGSVKTLRGRILAQLDFYDALKTITVEGIKELLLQKEYTQSDLDDSTFKSDLEGIAATKAGPEYASLVPLYLPSILKDLDFNILDLYIIQGFILCDTSVERESQKIAPFILSAMTTNRVDLQGLNEEALTAEIAGRVEQGKYNLLRLELPEREKPSSPPPIVIETASYNKGDVKNFVDADKHPIEELDKRYHLLESWLDANERMAVDSRIKYIKDRMEIFKNKAQDLLRSRKSMKDSKDPLNELKGIREGVDDREGYFTAIEKVGKKLKTREEQVIGEIRDGTAQEESYSNKVKGMASLYGFQWLTGLHENLERVIQQMKNLHNPKSANYLSKELFEEKLTEAEDMYNQTAFIEKHKETLGEINHLIQEIDDAIHILADYCTGKNEEEYLFSLYDSFKERYGNLVLSADFEEKMASFKNDFQRTSDSIQNAISIARKKDEIYAMIDVQEEIFQKNRDIYLKPPEEYGQKIKAFKGLIESLNHEKVYIKQNDISAIMAGEKSDFFTFDSQPMLKKIKEADEKLKEIIEEKHLLILKEVENLERFFESICTWFDESIIPYYIGPPQEIEKLRKVVRARREFIQIFKKALISDDKSEENLKNYYKRIFHILYSSIASTPMRAVVDKLINQETFRLGKELNSTIVSFGSALVCKQPTLKYSSYHIYTLVTVFGIRDKSYVELLDQSGQKIERLTRECVEDPEVSKLLNIINSAYTKWKLYKKGKIYPLFEVLNALDLAFIFYTDLFKDNHQFPVVDSLLTIQKAYELSFECCTKYLTDLSFKFKDSRDEEAVKGGSELLKADYKEVNPSFEETLWPEYIGEVVKNYLEDPTKRQLGSVRGDDVLQVTLAELERLQGEEKTQIPVINEMKIGWPEETMGIEWAFHFARSRQLFFEEDGKFHYFGSGVPNNSAAEELPEIINFGDKHGFANDLEQILSVAKKAALEGRKLVIIGHGDVFDRGPNSYKNFQILKKLKQLAKDKPNISVHLCFGDHEIEMIQGLLLRLEPKYDNWKNSNGGDETIKDFRANNAKVRELALWLLQNLEFFHIDERGFVNIHAGIPMDDDGNPSIKRQQLEKWAKELKSIQESLRSDHGFLKDENNRLKVIDLFEETHDLFWIEQYKWIDKVMKGVKLHSLVDSQQTNEEVMAFYDIDKAKLDNFLNQLGLNGMVFSHLHAGTLINIDDRVFCVAGYDGSADNGHLVSDRNGTITYSDPINQRNIVVKTGKDVLQVTLAELERLQGEEKTQIPVIVEDDSDYNESIVTAYNIIKKFKRGGVITEHEIATAIDGLGDFIIGLEDEAELKDLDDHDKRQYREAQFLIGWLCFIQSKLEEEKPTQIRAEEATEKAGHTEIIEMPQPKKEGVKPEDIAAISKKAERYIARINSHIENIKGEILTTYDLGIEVALIMKMLDELKRISHDRQLVQVLFDKLAEVVVRYGMTLNWQDSDITKEAHIEAGQKILNEVLPRWAYSKGEIAKAEVDKALDILRASCIVQRTAYGQKQEPTIYDTINIVFMKEALGILEKYKDDPIQKSLKKKLGKLVHWAHAITVFFAKYHLYMKLREAAGELQSQFKAGKDMSASIQKLQKLLRAKTDKNIPEVRQWENAGMGLENIYKLKEEYNIELIIIHFLSHMLRVDCYFAVQAIDSLATAVNEKNDIEDHMNDVQEYLNNIKENTIALGHLISDDIIEKMTDKKMGSKFFEYAREEAASQNYTITGTANDLEQDLRRRAEEPLAGEKPSAAASQALPLPEPLLEQASDGQSNISSDAQTKGTFGPNTIGAAEMPKAPILPSEIDFSQKLKMITEVLNNPPPSVTDLASLFTFITDSSSGMPAILKAQKTIKEKYNALICLCSMLKPGDFQSKIAKRIIKEAKSIAEVTKDKFDLLYKDIPPLHKDIAWLCVTFFLRRGIYFADDSLRDVFQEIFMELFAAEENNPVISEAELRKIGFKATSRLIRDAKKYRNLLLELEQDYVKLPQERTLAERLRSRRIYLGPSQQQLARRLKIRQDAISNYECGKCFPRPIRLMQLAEALDTSVCWLLIGILEEELMGTPIENEKRPLYRQLVGLKLKVSRFKKGLTIEQLAKRAKVGERSIRRLEKGKCSMTNPRVIKNLVKELDISMSQLLTGIAEEELMKQRMENEYGPEQKRLFGRKIKILRFKKGLTVVELARKIGVIPATIFRWERGERFPINPLHLNKLAGALGTSVSLLIAGMSEEELMNILIDDEKDPECMKIFGLKLRILRYKRGLQKRKFSNKIVVGSNRLWVWENGRQFPKLPRYINGLATSLDTSLSQLLAGMPEEKLMGKCVEDEQDQRKNRLLGLKIEILRYKKGLTIRGLVGRMKTKPGFNLVSDWEQGKYFVSPQYAEALAEALETSVSKLIAGIPEEELMNIFIKNKNNPEQRKRFGVKVKVLRYKSGLSQPQLSLKTGIPQTTLSNMERGKMFLLTSQQAENLAYALDTMPQEFWGGQVALELEKDLRRRAEKPLAGEKQRAVADQGQTLDSAGPAAPIPSSGIRKVFLNGKETSAQEIREEMAKIAEGGYIFDIGGIDKDNQILYFGTNEFGGERNIYHTESFFTGRVASNNTLMLGFNTKNLRVIRGQQRMRADVYVILARFFVEHEFPSSFELHNGTKIDMEKLNLFEPVPQTIGELARQPPAGEKQSAVAGQGRALNDKGATAQQIAVEAAYNAFTQSKFSIAKTLLADSPNEVLLRVTIDPLKQMSDDQREETRAFLEEFQKSKNGYVELYSSEGTGEISDEEYKGYVTKNLKEGFKRSRENTITLFGVDRDKDKNLSLTDIRSRIGDINLNPLDTILSPIGARDDPAGVIRGALFGLELLYIARQKKFLDTIDTEFADEAVKIYNALYNSITKSESALVAGDIIDLAAAEDINQLIRALKKFIEFLPAGPVDKEKFHRINENTKTVVRNA